MKTQDLNQEEQKSINGGSLAGNGLLGNDGNTFQGYDLGNDKVHNTDDSGRTSSSQVNYGTGSLLDSLD